MSVKSVEALAFMPGSYHAGILIRPGVKSAMRPEFQPLGDCGVRVCFGAEISPAISARVHRLGAALDADPIRGVTEWVLGYATVTVYYQPWIVSYQTLCDELAARTRRRYGGGELPARLIEIPVCYGDAFGPDLTEVAIAYGLTPAQVVRRHSRPRYLVYFLGFLPGFAYLGGLPDSLATPRRTTPRASVPAGSVGIAGAQTGVYPLDSPGGWQIIGRTPLQLYDPDRQPPALIRSGDRVKFVPITSKQYEELREYGPGD